MSGELVKDPPRFQMVIYGVIDSLIHFLGKLRMWVISPDGKFNEQYFEDVKEGLDKVKPDPYLPMLFRCLKCQELYILWERDEALEWIPVWPEYALADDGVEEQKEGVVEVSCKL